MISIIICSITPEKFSNITRNYTGLMGDEPFEIIGIHDAKSLCEGYNRGIKKSVGDILIFSHDDIEILSSDFVARLKNHLMHFDVVGLAGTDKVVDGWWTHAGVPYLYGQVANPYKAEYVVNFFDYGKTAHQKKVTADGIKMLDGLFFATKRAVVERVLFDEKNFDGFHCYDTDFTYSAFLAGFSLTACNDIAVIHDSNGSFDKFFQKYNQRFIDKHAATIDAPEPLAGRPPIHAWDNYPDKASVLRSFLPEVQSNVCRQFVAMFPILIKPPNNTFIRRFYLQGRRFVWRIIRRAASCMRAMGCWVSGS